MADGRGADYPYQPELKTRLTARHAALKTERAPWLNHWRDLSRQLAPRTGRWLAQDRNRGGKRHNDIIDNTALRAVRILGAGMMTGMNSPSKPWVRLQTFDPELMKRESVKVWCNMVTERMRDVFARSNIYRALHSLYEELGVYGTGSAIVVPDFQNVIHTHSLTAGEYCLATDSRGDVNTLYREYSMTTAQLVSAFGLENCSTTVQNAVRYGRNLDQWWDVTHVIEPRADRDVSKLDNKNMAWRSTYYECASNEQKVLRDSGFRRFPGICPRWVTSGEDVYGSSPGMEALGDAKQLQFQQRKKLKAIDMQADPPVQVPTMLQGQPYSLLPGGISYYDQNNPHGGIRPSFEVKLDLQHLLVDIQDVRERINASFYVDLFLMIAQSDGAMTAREVVERHEEKLLMLGPVLERLQNEMLKPLVDITFDRMLETGIIPLESIPDEIRDQDLKIVFVGLLAQAQRMAGIANIERGLSSIGTLIAPLKPEVMDKIDTDAVVDTMADMLGWDPDMIHSEDEVAATREARAQQQTALAQAAALPPTAAATKDMAQADALDRGA